MFGSCAGFEGNGVNFGESWNGFDFLLFASRGAVFVDGGCYGCDDILAGLLTDYVGAPAANNGQNAQPGLPKPPNPILQNCGGSTSAPPTGTEQDLEGLAALSHVADTLPITMTFRGNTFLFGYPGATVKDMLSDWRGMLASPPYGTTYLDPTKAFCAGCVLQP